MHRWLKSKGICGRLTRPEDFIVKEIPPKFKKYERYKSGVRRIEGLYTLLLLKKKNMTTKDALNIISKKFNIEKIGYAGMKDKFAVTFQYITVKGDIENFKESNLEAEKICKVNRWLDIGDLEGNEFIITLHRCRIGNMQRLMNEIKERGIPNYFGPQRFGKNLNNHKIGKYIIKKEFNKALSLINKNCKKKYDNIHCVSKDLLKFFIHSYQSWIFNKILDEYIRQNKIAKKIEIIGYDTKTRGGIINKIIRKEKIRPEDFRIDELMISCSGTKRKAFIRPKIKYEVKDDDVQLSFSLPKGSYATVLLYEISGNNFMPDKL